MSCIKNLPIVMLIIALAACENRPTLSRTNPVNIGPHPDCKLNQCIVSAQPAGDTCQITYKTKGSACNDGNPKTENDNCNGAGLCGGDVAKSSLILENPEISGSLETL
ncbi:MAG: hypothetical protein AB8G05_15875 [Oligoflexales bacterium]